MLQLSLNELLLVFGTKGGRVELVPVFQLLFAEARVQLVHAALAGLVAGHRQSETAGAIFVHQLHLSQGWKLLEF